MNMKSWLKDLSDNGTKKAMPILTFPAAQKLNVTVEELVKDASLQAKAMELIAKETETAASVSFMDLSVEAEAFGARINFTPDEVPAVIGNIVSDADSANALKVPSLNTARIPTFINAIKLAKENITEKPVFSGMIGPYSLAGRLMDVTEIMLFCFDEPDTVHTVLEKATQFLINYATALKIAGANGVVVAEPLAGLLSPAMAEEFAVPYMKKIIAAVQDDDFAVIYHNCGNAVVRLSDLIFSQGATAYHFGNAIDMKEILSVAPENAICMGNIDPVSCFTKGTAEEMRFAVRKLIDECGSYKNFIVSSGCDIPYHAKWENINAFFEALD